MLVVQGSLTVPSSRVKQSQEDGVGGGPFSEEVTEPLILVGKGSLN
jgi:hypothetical protein